MPSSWLEALDRANRAICNLFLSDSIRFNLERKKCSLGIPGGGSDGRGVGHIADVLRFWEPHS